MLVDLTSVDAIEAGLRKAAALPSPNPAARAAKPRSTACGGKERAERVLQNGGTMSGMHGHHHGGAHVTRAADRRLLGFSLAPLSSPSWSRSTRDLASSLALLADAGHMLTDAAALALALVVVSLAARPAGGRSDLRPGRG